MKYVYIVEFIGPDPDDQWGCFWEWYNSRSAARAAVASRKWGSRTSYRVVQYARGRVVR